MEIPLKNFVRYQNPLVHEQYYTYFHHFEYNRSKKINHVFVIWVFWIIIYLYHVVQIFVRNLAFWDISVSD